MRHIFGERPWKSRTDVLMEEEALKLAEERAPKAATPDAVEGGNADSTELPANATLHTAETDKAPQTAENEAEQPSKTPGNE